MGGYNKVIVLGNMGKEPELTYTQGGMAICKFTLATSKKKKDGKEVTSWHKCVAFDKTAETIAKFVTKGQTILIEGELLYGQYEKDGITRYTTDIAVNSFTFAGKGNTPDHAASNNGSSSSSSFVPMEDDIPF